MDMQNVSNLTIPEGEVRTIHNSNNQLLWGRVNYDTEYAGDTFQQTYSGKNLAGFDSPDSVYGATYTASGGIYTLTATSTSISIRFPLLKNISAGTYTWSGSIAGFTASPRKTDGTSLGVNSNYAPYTFTISEDMAYMTFFAAATVGQTLTLDLAHFMIEQGATPTSYEPFVGGTASPNPSFPQPIQVATGTQVVSITDGTNTQNFTVNLSSTELAKIGTYQDYIYKSGDDWYVHKAIYKKILDGSESWAFNFNNALLVYIFNSPLGIFQNSSTEIIGLSDYYNHSSYELLYTKNRDFGLSYGNATADRFCIRDIRYCAPSGSSTTPAGTVADFKTWLSGHNLSVYYALATPTDTQITDSTLISQLNAVHQWLVRYGYNASVTGNLPIIIDRTNL